MGPRTGRGSVEVNSPTRPKVPKRFSWSVLRPGVPLGPSSARPLGLFRRDVGPRRSPGQSIRDPPTGPDPPTDPDPGSEVVVSIHWNEFKTRSYREKHFTPLTYSTYQEFTNKSSS